MDEVGCDRSSSSHANNTGSCTGTATAAPACESVAGGSCRGQSDAGVVYIGFKTVQSAVDARRTAGHRAAGRGGRADAQLEGGIRSGEEPISRGVGISGASQVVGPHLPVIGGAGGQSAQGFVGGRTGGNPGTAGIIIGGVVADTVAGGTSAGSPTQGGIGRLVDGAVARAGLAEGPRGGGV